MLDLDALHGTLGNAHVLTGADMARYCEDWTGRYRWTPLAVARPADTAGVAAVMRQAAAAGVAVVPVAGNTGLNGGAFAQDALMLSVERLNRIGPVNRLRRTVEVGAGAILSQVHEAVAAADLCFPVSFGAQDSAMIGGILATNAGGSNVLRHGNTRAQVLGLEAVLPDGRWPMAGWSI